MNCIEGIEFRNRIKPGDIGTIVYMHEVLYAKEYGFDHTFGAYVAAPLADFVLKRTHREQIWIAERKGVFCGSIAIVRVMENEAQLRWLLVKPAERGIGLGRILVEKAVDFCKSQHYDHIFLWTIRFLRPATHIYRTAGFEKTEEKTHEIWGLMLTEERYVLKI